MAVKTGERWAYWLNPVNLTGMLGQKTFAQISRALGPDGTFDTGVPGTLDWDNALNDYGTFTLDNIQIPLITDVQVQDQNAEGINELHAYLAYLDETQTDIYAVLGGALAYDSSNPAAYATGNITVSLSPRMIADSFDFNVGDYLIFNDTREDTENSGASTPRGSPPRRYECFQISAKTGNNWTIQRHDPTATAEPRMGMFGSWITSHLSGCKIYLVKLQHFTWKISSNVQPLSRTVADPLPPRVDGTWPSTCIVAVLASAKNYYGFSPWVIKNASSIWVSDTSVEIAPGLRTLTGAAYVFRQDGDLIVATDVVTPQQVHEWASVRTIYAVVTNPPVGADLIISVKFRPSPTDPWVVLTTLTIPDGELNSYEDDPSGDTPTQRRMPFTAGYNNTDSIYGPENWPIHVLEGDGEFGADITQIGSSLPGTNLMLYMQT